MKVVITGRSGCGKSSVIDELKSRGFRVMPEWARVVIKELGYSNRELTRDEYKRVQSGIYDKYLEAELKMDADDPRNVYFLDRGWPEIRGFCNGRLGGVPDDLKEKDLLVSRSLKRYDAVFLLPNRPFEKDSERVETDEADAQRMLEHVLMSYDVEGYTIRQVHVRPEFETALYKSIVISDTFFRDIMPGLFGKKKN